MKDVDQSSIGVAVALGVAFWLIFDNLALGIVFGMLFGAGFSQRKKADGDEPDKD